MSGLKIRMGIFRKYDPSLVRVTGSRREWLEGEDLKDYQYENKEGDKTLSSQRSVRRDTGLNGKWEISDLFCTDLWTGKQRMRGREENGGSWNRLCGEDAVSQAEEAVRSISTDESSEKKPQKIRKMP